MSRLICHAEIISFKGNIKGSCDIKGREDTIQVFNMSGSGHLKENVSLEELRAYIYGRPRSHGALTLCKAMDKSTPRLLQALSTNEPIFQVILRLYRINRRAHEEHYYTITLENALVKGLIQAHRLEYVSFIFEKITWRHEIDQIEAEDSWQMVTTPKGIPIFSGQETPKKEEFTFIDLEYLHADKTPVAGATYEVISTDRKGQDSGDFSYKGTLDQNGKAHIDGVPLHPTGSYRYLFTADEQEFEVFEDKQPKAKPHEKESQGIFYKAGQWFWKFIQGDFNKDQEISHIAANTLLGLVPFVDQGLDIRDIIAGLLAILDFYGLEPEVRADKEKHPDTLGMSFELFLWVTVFLIAIGCIPMVGSAVKGVFKGMIKHISDILKKGGTLLDPGQAKKLWEFCISILNRFGKGNAHRFLKSMPDKLSTWMDKAEEILRHALDNMDSILKKAESYVKKPWVQSMIPADKLSRVNIDLIKIRKAMTEASGKLGDMKLAVKEKFSQWIDMALSGKHNFDASGRAGRAESRAQKAIDPPEIEKPKVKKSLEQENAQLNKQNKKNAEIGHPVNAITGAVVEAVTDFILPGRMPLAWERHYSSQTPGTGLLGPGWQCPADARLVINDDDTVTFYHGSKTASIFAHAPTKDKKAIADVKSDYFLHQNPSHYTITDKNNINHYFPKKDQATSLYRDRITDSKGNSLVFHREGRNLTTIEDSSGQKITVISEKGCIRRMVRIMPDNSAVKLVEYTYDNDTGDLVTAHDSLNSPLAYTYTNHCLTGLTLRSGQSFFYDYDQCTPQGKCLHTWGDDGLYDYRFEYHDIGRETRITSSKGQSRIIEYDENFNPLAFRDHKNHVTRHEYDATGRPTAIIDPLGRKTEYHYDHLGNLTRVIRPDEAQITMDYDGNCNPISITDPNGNHWQQKFEDRALLTQRISPTGAQTLYEYNTKGDLISFTDPIGAKTLFDHNPLGQVTQITDALGQVKIIERDSFGNISAIIDPQGKKTRYTYDDKFRLTRITTPSNKDIYCTYDAADRLVSHKDEAGNITRLTYTGMGQIKTRTNPDGTTITYDYDNEERLKTLTNQRGEIFEFKHDHAGRITHEIDYWGNESRYTYDPAGQLIQSLDPLNRITDFTFDSLGRLIQKTGSDRTLESYTYDANGNLTTHENEHAKTQRIYDAENRLTQEIQGDHSTTHEYDILGNRTRRLSSTGNDIRFDHDILGRTQAITINNKRMDITRNALGLPITESFDSGLNRTYDYTTDNVLSNQAITLPTGKTISRAYEYDPVGNLTARMDSDKGSRFFTYNPMGQITQYTDPEQKIKEFLHDPAGDLFKRGDKEEYDGSRHLNHEKTDYHFNAAGNLISRKGKRGHHTFEWDASNRLTSAYNHESYTRTSMTYDALGRRLSKITNALTTTFTWDGDQLLSDNLGEDNPREFVYYPNTFELLAIIDKDKKVHYVHNDSVGLPQEITDEAGTIVWSASFDALGNIEKIHENQFDNPIRFQGQYFDPELDLSYNRHRYFDARTGSFISQDPLGLAAGDNVYSYAP
ncbi:MAG: type VI secretion system tube protein Hcp, partial [Proteobacteria bacterium]|nr:type VI secretion system tube protein Hcp [Pseudomonadota bacterium]